MDELWLQLVEAVRAFCEANLHDEPVALSVMLRHLPQVCLPLPLPGRQSAPAVGQPSPTTGQPTQDTPDLTDTQQAILDVLTRAERTLKGRTIAARAGKNFTPHFRQTLAGMVRAKKLVKAEGGYWLASRPLPT